MRDKNLNRLIPAISGIEPRHIVGRLEHALELFRIWFQVGDLEMLYRTAREYEPEFSKVGRVDYNQILSEVVTEVDLISNFETTFGCGSFLNVEHQSVVSSDIWRKRSYSVSTLEAAFMAQSERTAFLSTLQSRPFRGDQETQR